MFLLRQDPGHGREGCSSTCLGIAIGDGGGRSRLHDTLSLLSSGRFMSCVCSTLDDYRSLREI